MVVAAVCNYNISYLPHIFWVPEYHGMSGKHRIKKYGGIPMCNNNCGFFGGNMCWIIILLILFCGCGGGSTMSGCGCGSDNGCGCC